MRGARARLERAAAAAAPRTDGRADGLATRHVALHLLNSERPRMSALKKVRTPGVAGPGRGVRLRVGRGQGPLGSLGTGSHAARAASSFARAERSAGRGRGSPDPGLWGSGCGAGAAEAGQAALGRRAGGADGDRGGGGVRLPRGSREGTGAQVGRPRLGRCSEGRERGLRLRGSGPGVVEGPLLRGRGGCSAGRGWPPPALQVGARAPGFFRGGC